MSVLRLISCSLFVRELLTMLRFVIVHFLGSIKGNFFISFRVMLGQLGKGSGC